MSIIVQQITDAAEAQFKTDPEGANNSINSVDITMIQGVLYYGTIDFEDAENGARWEADFTYNTDTQEIYIS